jgi:hypothetical protein
MENRPTYNRVSDQEVMAKITGHLNLNWDETVEIPVESLNVRGKAIQDEMETYLEAGDTFYSSSDFKEAVKSPLHLHFSRISGWKEALNSFLKKKDHFELGTLIHECILEPEKFDKVIALPNFKMSETAGVEGLIQWYKDKAKGVSEDRFIELYAKVQNTLAGGSVDTSKLPGKKAEAALWEKYSELYTVSEDSATIAKIVREAVEEYAGGIIPRLLKGSRREMSMYDDKNFSLPIKIRPDALLFEENIGVNAVLSVKTTAMANPRAFFAQYAKLEYTVSDAMYEEVASKVTGRKFNCTIVLMIQTSAPFGVGLFAVKQNDIQMAKVKFRAALETATECEKTGEYPGYEALADSGNMGISYVDLPNWYQEELLDFEE